MRSFKYIISHPLCLGAMFTRKFLSRKLPDTLYLKLLYFFEMGHVLSLRNPQRFTEKIQWLKIYNRRQEYTQMVDKLAAKKYVSKKIDTRYIIPTLGVWKSFDDIDFESLPNSFILKTNNGSGGNVYICKDKDRMDVIKARQILTHSESGNIGITYREYPYLNINPLIFAEPLLTDYKNEDLIDYKFFCFNGRPIYCQVIQGRRSVETIDFYDLEWNRQNFIGLNPKAKSSRNGITKPDNLDKMIEIAAILSREQPFIRIDLYNVCGKIYFGEMTFYPASGYGRFTPKEWDIKLGKLIQLPRLN